MAYAGVGAGLEGVLCGLKVEPIDCRLSWAGSLLPASSCSCLGVIWARMKSHYRHSFQSSANLVACASGREGGGEDEPTGAGVSQTLGWLSRISIEAETEMPRAMRGEARRVESFSFLFGLVH